MDRSQQIFTNHTFVQLTDGIPIVITFPRHISNKQILTQCQFTVLSRITLRQYLAFCYPVTSVADRTKVNSHILVSLAEFRNSIFFQSRFKINKCFTLRIIRHIRIDATTIRILYDRTEDEEFVSFESALKEYRIPKFRKTNQNMTIDLRPICNRGDRVTKGQILTEGYSTENGELALGKNLLVAYMPWKGYNYEDAIVLNERVVREDLLTSVHVEEYSLEVRETKRGMEELTSDIPNVSEEATKDLDENGIVRIGARIQPGDIMIGKITPKGESDPSPEEKLLRAIFGDKAGDVKDASLKASPSLKGFF